MKFNIHRLVLAALTVAGSFALPHGAEANTNVFAYSNRDLMLCFRKTGYTGGSISPNDLEINIGQASIYYGAMPGSVTPINNLSGSQIAIFDNLNDIAWSVGGCVSLSDNGGDIPQQTLWVTAPRTDPNVAATPWVRNGSFTQGPTAQKIKSVLDNAVFYSSTVASNSVNNTTTGVVVPTAGGHNYGSFVGTAGTGNYLNTFQGNVEHTNASDFVTAGLPARSDFYELRPDSTGTQPVGKYLGYFEMSTNGTVVFVAAPFPAPILNIQRSGTTDTIQFGTTNGATYTLYYTNATGLTQPLISWPFIGTNVSGDGTTKSFQVDSSDPNRFYSVQVH
jgi:hypothetical protein